MRCLRLLQQARRNGIKYAAAIAAIFLVATTCPAQSKPEKAATPAEQQPGLALTQELNKYPGLLPEFGQLLAKLQNNVQFPAPRSESRLLPLLPASTMSYIAFPNYGDAANQALQVLRQELQDSAVLRDWWHHGDMATGGAKIEETLEKFYQLHQYLGDEIVVSGAMEGQNAKFLAVAEIRKPGLKKFLEQLVTEYGGESKAGVRVLDLQELATAKDKNPEELTLVVRPDFILVAENVAALRSFSTALDVRSQEFASIAFGRRVAQEYQGGVTVLGGADLQKIMNQTSPGSKQSAEFQRSGFADMKYLIWEHKGEGTQSFSQGELSFTGPRRGSASWLAKPAPLGSLDFVSPDAMMAGAVVLTSLSQIFDDVKELGGPSSADPFAAIAGGEKALNLSVKDDLLNQLGGELTIELDTITPRQPAWKAMFSVRDTARLQKTLNTLLAVTQIQTEHVDDPGGAYSTVRIPSQNPVELAYTFVDGYLIIASSRDGLAEAVRLHRSGGSLAKSPKFLAARPPGHSPDASALFYEDPLRMVALQMQRLAPDLAQSLAQASSVASPAVVYLYGDETAIREASSSGAFDVGGILVVAAIAIPNLLRSRMAANEASAVGSLRSLNTAQITYEATYPKKGFTPNLATLGQDSRGANFQSPDHASFLDDTLVNQTCAGDAWCTRSGYHFRVTASCKQHVCTEYIVVATPVDNNTGTRSFCSTSEGVVRWKKSAPLTSPPTVAECKSWQVLQ